MKIYTRTGDSGDTGLFDGTRVQKSDARVAAYGDVDELNAWLGLVVASLDDEDLAPKLVADPARPVRDRVAARGSRRIASPSGSRRRRSPADDVARLEGWIDALDGELRAAAPLHPGGRVAGRRRSSRRAGPCAAGPSGRWSRSATQAFETELLHLRQPPVGSAVHHGAGRQPARRCAGSRVVSASSPAVFPALSTAPTPPVRSSRAITTRIFRWRRVLLPGAMRRTSSAIYAFARTADDFADEPGYSRLGERLRLLDDWLMQLGCRGSGRPPDSCCRHRGRSLGRRSDLRRRSRDAIRECTTCRCRCSTIC